MLWPNHHNVASGNSLVENIWTFSTKRSKEILAIYLRIEPKECCLLCPEQYSWASQHKFSREPWPILIEDLGLSRKKLQIVKALIWSRQYQFGSRPAFHHLNSRFRACFMSFTFCRVKIYRRTISIQLQVFQIGADLLLLSAVEMQRKYITKSTFTCPRNDAVKFHWVLTWIDHLWIDSIFKACLLSCTLSRWRSTEEQYWSSFRCFKSEPTCSFYLQ